MGELKWDDKAAAVFAQYQMDIIGGLEKEDPNVNISSIEELLRDD